MDAIEDAYAIHKSGNYKMPDRFIAQRDKNMMLYMPCFLDSVIGTKMLSEFPDNPSLGIPYLNGLMILNNAKTGLPKAIMNGSALTAMRTGAVGGVALRYLAPEDAASVGLVGCGMQGLHQLLYACEVRPITDIYLYDAYAKDLSGFIERLSARLASFGKNAIQIHTCADTRELAEHSRVLISATQAVDPVYRMMKSCFAVNALLPSAPGVRNGANCRMRCGNSSRTRTPSFRMPARRAAI